MDELDNQNAYVHHQRYAETKTSAVLEQYFGPLKQYLEVLQNSRIIHSFIIVGSPGTGKSFTVIQGLNQSGKMHGRDYVILNCYSTPLALYEFLYHNNGKTIVCDDISSIFKNDTCKKILLSSLWSPAEERIAHYESKTGKLTAPNEFSFRGKIIIIANSLPEELENLKSRGLFYNLHFTYREKIEIVYEICRTYGIPLEIAEFIRNSTNEAYEINFRLPLILWEIYKTHRNNGWQRLAFKQLRLQGTCEERCGGDSVSVRKPDLAFCLRKANQKSKDSPKNFG
jgi:hypothetical protein